MTPHETITGAIRDSVAAGRPALVAFITAGFPESERFIEHLTAIGNEADVVEIGVPFSDPMADGLTIQRSSHIALAQGVSLRWILAELTRMQPKPRAPLLLMSYLNPLMAYGFDSLPTAARAAGVSGFIVPDLPFEESAELRAALEAEGLGLVQLVTSTPDDVPVEPHEETHLLGAPFPVLGGEGIGRQVAHPDLDGPGHDVEQCCLPRLVALGPG